MNSYIGHTLQISGVEEHRLVGGKGDGMRMYHVSNGLGVEMDLSPDRNGDIQRLRFKGVNMSYMSPCGYVAPAFYDHRDDNWLRSFTAGFLTTCGFQNVGVINEDNGELLPMHGTIANQPCEHSYWTEDEDAIHIHFTTKDQVIFGRKLTLHRTVEVSKKENVFTIKDELTNEGDTTQPVEVLYHMNMGYPLLDEDSIVKVEADTVVPRDKEAAVGIDTWMQMEKPQANYQEQCFYHQFSRVVGKASIFQPKLNVGLVIEFERDTLDCFTEWKMMGRRDYVLGLECGNCYPDGRDVMREKGILKFIGPDEKVNYNVKITLLDK